MLQMEKSRIIGIELYIFIFHSSRRGGESGVFHGGAE